MSKTQKNSKRELRAVILAAGLGKRMRSSTAKVLHHVLGQPMIWRVLQTINQLSKALPPMSAEFAASEYSLDQVHIVLGHNFEQVEKCIKGYMEQNNSSLSISIHKQEPQLGTGHALMSLRDVLKDYQGDLLVLSGDCPLLNREILTALIDAHSSKKANLSLVTTMLSDPTGYGRIRRSVSQQIIGIVEHKDADDKEKRIQEINAAIYCLNWPIVSKGLSQLKNDNKQGEYYLPDLVGWAAREDYKIASISVSDWRQVMGVNSRVELAQANKLLNELVTDRLALDNGVTIIDPSSTWISPESKIEQDTVILPGCWLIGDISIGKGCVIGPNTVFEGKVTIGAQTKIVQSRLEDCQVGNDCQIGPFAHLRPGTVVNSNVRVGNFVEIKNSSIGNQTNVSHLSYVGDTTVGKEANIGAGTITANYDHITKKKANTVIEDGAAIGSNSVLIAPVRVGKESVVAAGTVITKDVEAGSLAVGRAKQENMPGWTAKRRQKATQSKK